ncbi:MAG: hypothetical protein QOJ12_2165 [Thermoleophilales bacterium]|nr:hypothetical protein [Thermoleophilales bacterium]
MTTQALSSPLPVSSRKRTVTVAVLAALVGAAITLGAVLGTNGGSPAVPHATTIAGGDFSVAFPAGWTAVKADQLAKLPGRPAAMVRRNDRHGAVVVRRKGAPKNQSLKALTTSLTTQLKARFPDFRFVSSRVVRLRAGNAFLYTFLRTRSKVAQSIAIVRVGKTSFTLDAVAAAGDNRAAREVAAIVRSFGR